MPIIIDSLNRQALVRSEHVESGFRAGWNSPSVVAQSSSAATADAERGAYQRAPIGRLHHQAERLQQARAAAARSVDSVLLLTYPFPPILSPGTFRSLRFVKYLPEFHWNPLVVSIDPRWLTRYEPVDPALLDELDCDLVVARTSAPRPMYRLEIISEWLGGKWRAATASGSRAASAVNHEVSGDAANHRSDGRGDLRGSGAKRLWQRAGALGRLLLETPDGAAGWVLPCVAAGLKLIRQFHPRVIYSTSPPRSSHLAACILQRATGLPLVLDFRDPWARTPWDPSSSLRRRIAATMERTCIRAADRVVLNTAELMEEFREHYRDQPPEKFCWISNGYDPDHRSRLCDANWLPPRGDQPLRLCHAGAVYGRRDLAPLVSALRLLVDQGHQVELVQVGCVDRLGELRQHIDRLDLASCVELLPPLPHDEALGKMARSDVLVVLQQGTHLQVPSKVFEMLLVERPILCLSSPGATANLVSRFELGVVVSPEDPSQIANGILEAARWAARPQARRRALDTFDGRALTRQLADVFSDVAATRPRGEVV